MAKDIKFAQDTRKAFLDKIMYVVTLLGGDENDAL